MYPVLNLGAKSKITDKALALKKLHASRRR